MSVYRLRGGTEETRQCIFSAALIQSLHGRSLTTFRGFARERGIRGPRGGGCADRYGEEVVVKSPEESAHTGDEPGRSERRAGDVSRSGRQGCAVSVYPNGSRGAG
ncbi:hypothetical protein EYF80_014335 [Liparis tanakae]|uniref:Uncharacterized protein n=1 Tax=Liparis tanakae TaxID=230148 RepID=A0A4Z2IEN9_9TELE|nr:hypothetical protein EYF80_014335 [Liparis tanakae]